MEQQLKENELLLQPVYYNCWCYTSQPGAPSRGLEEAGPTICGWRDLSDTEKVLLPLAPAQFDPHTKSSSNWIHRQLQLQDSLRG